MLTEPWWRTHEGLQSLWLGKRLFAITKGYHWVAKQATGLCGSFHKEKSIFLTLESGWPCDLLWLQVMLPEFWAWASRALGRPEVIATWTRSANLLDKRQMAHRLSLPPANHQPTWVRHWLPTEVPEWSQSRPAEISSCPHHKLKKTPLI